MGKPQSDDAACFFDGRRAVAGQSGNFVSAGSERGRTWASEISDHLWPASRALEESRRLARSGLVWAESSGWRCGYWTAARPPNLGAACSGDGIVITATTWHTRSAAIAPVLAPAASLISSRPIFGPPAPFRVHATTGHHGATMSPHLSHCATNCRLEPAAGAQKSRIAPVGGSRPRRRRARGAIGASRWLSFLVVPNPTPRPAP
jgi:hypothetical protein